MPYVGLSENGLQITTGSFGEIFLELSHQLNFSFTVTNPPDGEWGRLKDDGTWSGMVGQLETKAVDFGKEDIRKVSVFLSETEPSHNFSTAVTDFTITKERSEVMTFSNPLDQIYHAVMIQNPINKYNFEAFTSPLAGLTWLMLLLWIVVTPPILFIASRYTAFNSFVPVRFSF